MQALRYLHLLLLSLMMLANSAFAAESVGELTIEQIAEGVYLHTSYADYEGFGLYAGNGLVVIVDDVVDDADGGTDASESRRAYIIDTPATQQDTEKLVAWFKDRGITITGSISSHFHIDSAAGVAWLNAQSIPTYASTLTNSLLKKQGQAEATHSFTATPFDLVADQIEVFYPGAGHSSDNVVIWLPQQKILFGGCFVKSKILGNLSDAVVADWPASAEKLLARYGHAKLVVPGHGVVGDSGLLVSTKELAVAAVEAGVKDPEVKD